MCGVFGFVANEKSSIKQSEIIKISDLLFKLSETRGKDASGITLQTGKKIFIYKKSVSASNLIKESYYRNYIEEILGNTFDRQGHVNGQISFMGHARMETNGSFCKNINNQPVVKDGVVTIHNGIITNDDKLWSKYPALKKNYEVDTEIANSLLNKFLEGGHDAIFAFRKLYSEIEGSASLGVYINTYNYLFLTTNTGSLYLLYDPDKKIHIFASELFILYSLLTKLSLGSNKNIQIEQLKPNSGCGINLSTLEKTPFLLHPDKKLSASIIKNKIEKKIIISKTEKMKVLNGAIGNLSKNRTEKIKKLINKSCEDNEKLIEEIKRCTKCILPVTMPFISFDKKGVCNYCLDYKKINLKGHAKLQEIVSRYRKNDGKPDSIVCLSGGRDSSYTLHYVKNVLKMNPIAYSYDWGMLTPLGRRNQARMCAKLGVEHILVAADIQKKRKFIKLNVEAWLKKPLLGMIPLFMAGDKQYFYYVNQIKKNNDIDLVFMGENHLEKTNFKNGFAGVKQKGSMAYHLSIFSKFKLGFYYLIQYLKNPFYFNASIIDTLSSFFSYFMIPHSYINLFDYIKWDEDLINKILIEKYNWETDKESKSTWRIGDGTSAFYNYIYYTVAGFSEYDTFRSNQIREGVITIEEALGLIKMENQPRFESIKWYFNTTKINFDKTLDIINKIEKRYKKLTVTLVGTLPPIKGISHYCTGQAISLSKCVDIDFINFKSIYPELLYPGGTKDEGKPLEETDALKIKNILVWYNPLSWIKAGLTAKGDIVHINYWTYYLFPIFFTIILVSKLRGKKIISTIHNITNHESNFVDFFFTKIILIISNNIIVHCDNNKLNLLNIFGVSLDKIITVPHGVDYQNNKSKLTKIKARKDLNILINKDIVLFIGIIRKYKGIATLIKAFSSVSKTLPNSLLIITGDPWISFDPYNRLIEKFHLEEKVVKDLKYISDDKLYNYLSAADIIVLPYESFQAQSGLASLALTFGKPLIVSDAGGLSDMVINKNMVFKQKDWHALADKIIHVLSNSRLKQSLENDSRILAKKYSWTNTASSVVELYSCLL